MTQNLRCYRFSEVLSANYYLLITLYSYRLPNMYFNTDFVTGIPWGRPGMKNFIGNGKQEKRFRLCPFPIHVSQTAQNRIGFRQLSLHLGSGEVTIAAVYSFELTAINGHEGIGKQVELAAQPQPDIGIPFPLSSRFRGELTQILT